MQEIEDEMFSDISDPAICGAKEPKIAMLLWMLHNGRKDGSKAIAEDNGVSFWERVKRIFD